VKPSVLRILLAPFQRLPDDLVLVRTSEMPQNSLASFPVNERSERTAFRISPSLQLDRKMAVINRELKRWRILQILLRVIQRYIVKKQPSLPPGVLGGNFRKILVSIDCAFRVGQ